MLKIITVHIVFVIGKCKYFAAEQVLLIHLFYESTELTDNVDFVI